MAQVNDIVPAQVRVIPNHFENKFMMPKSTTAPITPTAMNFKKRIRS
jgi:hypothetical protein